MHDSELRDAIQKALDNNDSDAKRVEAIRLELHIYDRVQEGVQAALANRSGGSNGQRRTPTRKTDKRRDGHDTRIPYVGQTFSTVWGPSKDERTTHEVKVLADGKLEYDGKEYTSVSGIAAAITGRDSINGYEFFKLTAEYAEGENDDKGSDDDSDGEAPASSNGSRARKGSRRANNLIS